jgi:hypothetical protein
VAIHHFHPSLIRYTIGTGNGKSFKLSETIPSDFVKKSIGAIGNGYSHADKCGESYFTAPSCALEEAQDDLDDVRETVRIMKVAHNAISAVHGSHNRKKSDGMVYQAPQQVKRQKSVDAKEVEEMVNEITVLQRAVAQLQLERDRPIAEKVKRPFRTIMSSRSFWK